MSLKDLNLKAVYRTEEDNILEDFYIPALEQSVKYDRAVGFFSAGMLSYAAQGLSAFINNNGNIRLIIGGELSPEDYLAIKTGYNLRSNFSEKAGEEFSEIFEYVIENTSDSLFFRRLELISFLVANGQLNIKVALRRRGMYHEKIGIFTDTEDNKIIFQGSANETTSALLPDFNFESINVFQSWRTELKDHFEPYVNGFEKLWENRVLNTFVIDFPAAAKKKLISIAKNAPTLITPKLEAELFNKEDRKIEQLSSEAVLPQVPKYLDGEEFSIREHQKKALENWKGKDLRGIMALATGAGKTITAIFGAVRIFTGAKRLFVTIAVPYQSLADQWVEVLHKFNIYPIKCYESTAQWNEELKQKISLYKDKFLPFVCVVVVNRTLQSETFQNLIKQVPGENFLWIGDECHHHSSEKMIECLPEQARWRLGLSATPENFWNKEATERLIEYYGAIVAEYSLKEALADKVLTPYKYFPILVDLTEGEAFEYEEISKKIGQIVAYNQSGQIDPETNESLKTLLIKRARIIGKAENKLIVLEQTLRGERPKPLTLFYCGDGSVEGEESGELIRQVEAVSSAIDKLGWRCSRFTAEESRAERQDILDSFRLGMIDAMVAIKCLDEGIDVPACRTAYILASSRNPKQFIQRRGRILRRSPGKEYAEIYDFIVKIPNSLLENNEIEKKLLRAELNRVAEFASLAMNSFDTVKILRPILKNYNLEYLLTEFININIDEDVEMFYPTPLDKISNETDENSVKPLKLYEDYSRQQVQQTFAPEDSFTRGAGLWGISGIVPIPKRPGDFVFFVTFSQEWGGHTFDEGITEEGILTWQSQPSQSLDMPQIKQFINHDESKNSIYLFLRTKRSGSYTYLGRLKYISHDLERENPVYFQWQIIEGAVPPQIRERIGLDPVS